MIKYIRQKKKKKKKGQCFHIMGECEISTKQYSCIQSSFLPAFKSCIKPKDKKQKTETSWFLGKYGKLRKRLPSQHLPAQGKQ